jgi:DNA-binding MarR family transcriptional regulator
MTDEVENGPGRFAYEGLDRVLHEKARLGIMTCLASNPEGLLFNDLKELCNLTDGNLSRHLQLLQQNGFVEIFKGYERKRPQTLCRFSEQGLEKYQNYLSELERVLQDAQALAGKQAGDYLSGVPSGWLAT